MKKVCNLHLCIIGSTNFGKSSIAASLIHVAATTDGGIHLLGSPTKILKMADDLTANGQLSGTGWEDIAKFQFQMQGPAGKSWQISLRDYPGALFAKYVLRISPLARVKKSFAQCVLIIKTLFTNWPWEWKRVLSENKKQTPIDAHAFDPTAEKKAIKLIHELERADALLILVPADVSNAKYGNDRLIYKQKLPEFIEKVLKNKPYTPVCLCINKWDMFDCGVEKLEDKLKEAPFWDYYQSLKLICEKELSVAALSAFGHHDPDDKEKIDINQEQKPLNVLETLLALAERAEKARFDRTNEEWSKSSWLKKALLFPFKTFNLSKNGFTDQNIRNNLLKMTVKAWGLLCLFMLMTVTVIIASVTAGLCINETIGFRKIESRFTEYKASPYLVDKNKLKDENTELNRQTLMRHVFFASKVADLYARLCEIEKKYNGDIVKEGKEFCKKGANRDIEPWSDPMQRKKRAEIRKEHLETAKDKLTLSNSIHELDTLITQEKDLLLDLENNRIFYKTAFDLLQDSDPRTICRKVRSFIDENKAARPEQEKLFEKLESHLDETEKSNAGELDCRITVSQHSHPAASSTPEQKAEQYRFLVAMIDEAETQFVEGSGNFRKFADMRTKFSKDEGHQNQYGPFDKEYNRIVSLDRPEKLRAIKHFLDGHTISDYPDRKEKLEKLQDIKKELVATISKEIADIEANNKDDKNLSAKQRIKRAEDKIEKYKSAENEFIQNSEEQTDVVRKKSEAEALRSDLQNYIQFDDRYAKLDQNNLRDVAAFLNNYKSSGYPQYKEKIADLEKRKGTLANDIQTVLDTQLTENPDKPECAASERINACNARIEACNAAIGKLIVGSDELHKIKEQRQAEADFLRKLETYRCFEKEVNERLAGEEKGKIRRIESFLTKYHEADYQDAYHKKLFTELKKRKEALLTGVKEKLKAALEQNKEDVTLSAAVIVSRARNRASACEGAKNEYVEGSPEWKDADKKLLDAENSITKWNRYVPFEKEFDLANNAPENEKLKKIDEFLRTYKENDYPKRSKKYEEIKQTKAETEKTIDKNLDAELKNLKEPAKNDFPGWIEYYEKKGNIFKRFRDYYPAASDSYKTKNMKKDNAVAQKEKYEKWNELHQRAELINRTEKDPEIVLPMIRTFFKDYPKEQNTAPEIEQDITDISKLQVKMATEICKKLDTELNSYKLEDCNDESSKQDVCSKCCSIIENKLYYLQGTDQLEIYKNKSGYFYNMLDESKKEQNFSDALTTLRGRLESPEYVPQEKIEHIKFFITSYSPEFKPKHSQVFSELESARERYKHETEWLKIEEEKLNRPDASDPDSLKEYRGKCESLYEEAKEFLDFSNLKSRVEKKRKELQGKISWVEKQIGDGTYTDIKKKEEAYKKDPSEENYKILCKALDGFDSEKPENIKHKGKVETIKKRSKKYYEIAQSFDRFIKNHNQTSWEDFRERVENDLQNFEITYQGYQIDYKRKYDKIKPYVQGMRYIKIRLQAWNFMNSRFDNSNQNVDCDVWLNRQAGSKGDLYRYKQGINWEREKGDTSPLNNGCKLTIDNMPSNGLHFVRFANTHKSSTNKNKNPRLNIYSSQTEIDIYRILVEARKKGECDIKISDQEAPNASITLRFEGLPEF